MKCEIESEIHWERKSQKIKDWFCSRKDWSRRPIAVFSTLINNAKKEKKYNAREKKVSNEMIICQRKFRMKRPWQKEGKKEKKKII